MRESVIYQDILQEGRQEGHLEVALNLLREGMPVETIAKVTGLTIAEITALAKSEGKRLIVPLTRAASPTPGQT